MCFILTNKEFYCIIECRIMLQNSLGIGQKEPPANQRLQGD